MSIIPIPPEIYCPKCGELIKMERIEDAKTKAKLEESGYVLGGRGMCNCGVTAVLCIKKLPENPTFTLMFNLYKLDIKNRGKSNVS